MGICVGLWEYMGVYGNLDKYDKVGGYGYLCMSMGICEFLRGYGSLWEPMKYLETPINSHRHPYIFDVSIKTHRHP